MAMRWLLPGGAFLAMAAGIGLLFLACTTLPPRNPGDLCSIFAEKRGWYEATRQSRERWGVPEPVLLAVLHQESRFRADAKPGYRRLLGVIPVGRLSSAYGYGQVKDGTWRDYVTKTGNSWARRDRFADAVDFVGWYADVIHRATSVAKTDAFHLYLAYHEGPAGFGRGSYQEKPWLLGVARKVEAQADRYARQYAGCSAGLARSAAAR